MSEKTPFYANTETGTSTPVGLDIARNIESVKKSVLVGRKVESPDIFVSSVAGFGFPGIPFVAGEPNPATFCQGEDAVFSAFLFNEGEPVTPDKFKIEARVKRTVRSVDVIWCGELENGIYSEKREGYYSVWIPADMTNNWYAGSYVLNIFLSESVGDGVGPHDRKISLIDTPFNIEYCGGSENPENAKRRGNLPNRTALGKTWPNSPDIIRG